MTHKIYNPFVIVIYILYVIMLTVLIILSLSIIANHSLTERLSEPQLDSSAWSDSPSDVSHNRAVPRRFSDQDPPNSKEWADEPSHLKLRYQPKVKSLSPEWQDD